MNLGSGGVDRGGHSAWWRSWLAVTAVAACAATVVESVLLQRRRSYFTGGFLSTDHLRGPLEAAAFIAASLLTDAAIIGVIVALVLWAAGRVRLPRTAALALALAAALAPLMVSDVITYRLLTMLGDAFDVRLMFDLTGRSVGEMLAVSSAHLARFAWAAGGALLLIAGVFWTLARRRRRHAPRRLEPIPLRRIVAAPVLLLVLATVGTGAVRSGSEILDNGLKRKPAGQLVGAMVETATDFDRDGFGVLGEPGDPGPFDARVQPYSLDIPGNGIDEDGLAGDLPRDVESYVEPSAPAGPWQSKPDVILFALESFRADLVGGTSDGRPVTPVLNALAARGVAARQAYSHNGYTIQSRRHIFSGSVADVRGVATLIDDFKANGYETAYFSGQDESFGRERGAVGFDRADVAFDARSEPQSRYSAYTTAGSLALPYTVLGAKVAAFLSARHTDRPLFLYVNFEDTHFPYHHPGIQPLLNRTVVGQFAIAPSRADAVRAMYMNTAANVDRAVGDVLDHARRVLAREPAVIALGDHGESLFDEGFLGHGYALNDAQTRIPLVMTNLAAVIEEPFGQADLRDIVGAALSRPALDRPMPSLQPAGSRAVFQYLGNIDRPAQIGFTTAAGRTIYDFRSGRVSIAGATWRHPAELGDDDRRAFTRLIQTWERMMLARRDAAGGDERSDVRSDQPD